MTMRKTAFLFMTLVMTAAPRPAGSQTTGYAPVNGLKMYYETHGKGEPVDIPRDFAYQNLAADVAAGAGDLISNFTSGVFESV